MKLVVKLRQKSNNGFKGPGGGGGSGRVGDLLIKDVWSFKLRGFLKALGVCGIMPWI